MTKWGGGGVTKTNSPDKLTKKETYYLLYRELNCRWLTFKTHIHQVLKLKMYK